MKQIKYRSDIDGLRAVAVLSVIIYHINSDLIPGGFLGVDIFFVISGYLITYLLLKDMTITHRFHLLEFYERRIKRIIPALLFMLIPTMIFGFLFLFPSDMHSFFESIIWSIFSAANIFFYASVDTGYFAKASEEIPLLHLWSLGVEEQFYIFWPFVILLLVKYVKSVKLQIAIISTLFLSSLYMAQILQVNMQPFAYYMLPTRAWELMSGSIAAILIFNGFSFSSKLNNFMSFLGVILLLIGFMYITKNHSVPGYAALPSIIGSTFIILSNSNKLTLVGRLLSLKPMVIMGLISYSAYLWHWPILAFTRYSLIEINSIKGLFILMASLVMAGISYLL